MRYLLSFAGDQDEPAERSVESLPEAVEALREICVFDGDVYSLEFRYLLRTLNSLQEEPTRITSSAGQRRPVDIEEVLDAAGDGARLAIFETALLTGGSPPARPFYRLRMTSPEDEISHTRHDTLQDCLQAISTAWQVDLALGDRFAWFLYRTEAEPADFAISAVCRHQATSIPVALSRAQAVLTSHHAALRLEAEIRSELSAGRLLGHDRG